MAHKHNSIASNSITQKVQRSCVSSISSVSLLGSQFDKQWWPSGSRAVTHWSAHKSLANGTSDWLTLMLVCQSCRLQNALLSFVNHIKNEFKIENKNIVNFQRKRFRRELSRRERLWFAQRPNLTAKTELLEAINKIPIFYGKNVWKHFSCKYRYISEPNVIRFESSPTNQLGLTTRTPRHIGRHFRTLFSALSHKVLIQIIENAFSLFSRKKLLKAFGSRLY